MKVTDVIHNCQDLASLKEASIDKKIYDAETFYIPLGREVAPLMVRELIENIENYKTKSRLMASR